MSIVGKVHQTQVVTERSKTCGARMYVGDIIELHVRNIFNSNPEQRARLGLVFSVEKGGWAFVLWSA